MMSCAVSAIVGGWGGAAVAADQTAMPESAQPAGVEQVVVTAERRTESVQKVPSTVQAFSGLTLESLNVASLDDILRYTPNVTYGNNGPGQGDVFMRGLSAGFRGNQSSGTIGNYPNVALYLDDQSMQFPARNVDIYMVDMQRVEVLEGPQGTLFGGGAEAGAIRYITNKPVLDETSGFAQASYGFTSGGDPNASANVTLNVPIITDKLAVRVVLYDDNHGGYINNVPATFDRSNADLGNYYWNIMPTNGVCPNGLPPGKAGVCSPSNSGQINNYAIARNAQNPVTYEGARLSILYKINSDWDVLIAQSIEKLDAEGLSVEYPYSSQISPTNTLTPLGSMEVTAFNPSYDRDDWENTAWTVNGKVGPISAVYTGGYMVRNISQQMEYTNYSRTGGGMYYQCTGGGTGWGGSDYCYSPSAYWQDTVRNTHLSNELRLSTPNDWQIRAIAGFYNEEFRVYDVMNFDYKTIPDCDPANLANALNGGPPCVANVRTAPGSTANDPGIRGNSTAFGEDTQRGYDQNAAFLSLDYDVLPTVTLTAGSRWYEYSEFEVGSQYATTNGCLDVPNGDCTSGDSNINSHHDNKVYVGFRSRLGAQWHITPDNMAYFTYSEGFRPGGFNRTTSDVAPGPGGLDQYMKPNSYAPDSLVNYEAGLKNELFDDRLQFNLSAYFMRWSSVQFNFFDPTELGNTTFAVNGPTYDVKGVEAQWAAELAEGLTLMGSATYNDDTQANSPCLLDNIPNTPAFGQCITQVIPKGGTQLEPFPNPFGSVGSVPSFSPTWEGNVRLRYDWMIADYAADAMVGANYIGSMYNQPATYTSGTGVLIPNTTFLRYFQPGYTTFDASFGMSRGNWNADLFGSNLGDSHASTFTSSAQFIKSEVPLRPRVVGLRIGYKF
jgi:iron complex outermembrane recepter protein